MTPPEEAARKRPERTSGDGEGRSELRQVERSIHTRIDGTEDRLQADLQQVKRELLARIDRSDAEVLGMLGRLTATVGELVRMHEGRAVESE